MTLSLCKKGFVTISALASMVLAFPFAAGFFMRQTAIPYLYDSVAGVPAREVALVLGAAAYPARLSDILQDLVDAAIDLYDSGKAKTLLMSGSPFEAEKMAEYARGKGVKPEDIKMDPEGLNTLASVQNATKDQKQVIIVTQDFHLPRALFMARRLGLDAVGLSADRHEYIKIFEFERRELLASTKAILDLVLAQD
jgi:vancomycin permeability regulator SanA